MKIKGKRVTLRPITIKDAPFFVRWMKDTQVNKHLIRRTATLRQELEWIRSIPKRKTTHVFAIDVGNVHIGMISLRNIDKRDKNAVYTILIGEKSYWGQGYGSEATKLILDYGFKKLKLHRISLEVYEYNKRGIRLYKKLGFKMEGKLRDQIFYNGKYYHTLVMGLLSKEWKF